MGGALKGGSAVLAGLIGLAIAAGPALGAGPGAVDDSFGDGGTVSASPGGGVAVLSGGLLPQSDGKIVAAGTFQVVRRGSQFPGEIFTALTRFTAGGSLDRDYGSAGWTLDDRFETTGPPAPGPADTVLVPGGELGTPPNAYGFVGRYTSDGAVDRTFGDEGAVKLDLPAGFYWARFVTAAPDGSVFAAVQGQSGEPFSTMRFGVAKLRPDGRPDRDWGNDGVVMTDLGQPVQETGRLVVQADKSLLMMTIARIAPFRSRLVVPPRRLENRIGVMNISAQIGREQHADAMVPRRIVKFDVYLKSAAAALQANDGADAQRDGLLRAHRAATGEPDQLIAFPRKRSLCLLRDGRGIPAV